MAIRFRCWEDGRNDPMPGSPPHFLREVGSLETLDPMRGYWIQTLDDVTISISN